MIAGLFFPFSGTYRKLDLQKRWWHRLAFVGLVLCVVVAFAEMFGGTLRSDIDTGKTTATPILPIKSEHGPWEQYASITSLPPLPKGYTAVVMLTGHGERLQFPADTTKGELTKAVCEELKQSDEACWKVVSENPAQAPVADHKEAEIDALRPALWRSVLKAIVIALAASLALNYLLQLAYRALIFVVFGKPESPPSLAS